MAPRSVPRPFLLQEREFTMQEGIVRRQAQLIGGEEGGGGGGGGGEGGEGGGGGGGGPRDSDLGLTIARRQ